MRVTNKDNLPPVLVRACENQRKPKDGAISCTELIDSPLIRRLKLQHWDSLEVDVSDMVWAMTGTALHQMVEKHGDGTSEIPLSAELGGMMITGTCDHLSHDLISDWKTTSVWSVILSDSWLKKVEQQLNIYRYLHYRMTGNLVPRVSACVIFRDWRKSDLLRNPAQYPSKNIIEYNLLCWTLDEVEKFIIERLSYFSDDNYVCNLDERWAKPDKFAVKKIGGKRAVRVYESELQAIDHADRESLVVEARPGGHLRCEEYCSVRSVCQFKILSGDDDE